MSLHIENLAKHYLAPDGSTTPVLDVPTFELADGEQVALLGGSGTGKTTLLHSIAGIVRPDGGKINFEVRPRPTGSRGWFARNWPKVLTFGLVYLFYKLVTIHDQIYANRHDSTVSNSPIRTDLTQLNEAERDAFRGEHIGYIFQTHHLLPGFTALENVLLGLTFTGRKADRNWAKHLLTEVGLSERLDYLPAKLSVGQQQRVAVARALANRPQLVLADEPTGALDPATAQQVLDLIRALCREVNASLILVTHDLKIASQLERVVRLDELNRRAVGAR